MRTFVTRWKVPIGMVSNLQLALIIWQTLSGAQVCRRGRPQSTCEHGQRRRQSRFEALGLAPERLAPEVLDMRAICSSAVSARVRLCCGPQSSTQKQGARRCQRVGAGKLAAPAKLAVGDQHISGAC